MGIDRDRTAARRGLLRRRGPAALGILLALALTACGGGGSPSSPTSSRAAATGDSNSAPAEAINQTITVGVATLQEQYPDPHLALLGGNLYPIMWADSEPLIRRDLNGKAIPNLATSWDVSPDGLTWTFTLRTDVKMQDGSPFTGEDFKTAVTRVKAGGADFAPFATFNKYVTGVDVVAPDKVVVHTNKPYPTLGLDAPVPIATDYYNRVGNAEFRKHPIAAGAFKFVSQELNNSMTFERFDGFFDKSRLPNFKTLILKIIPDETTRIAALKTGAIDLAGGLSPTGANDVSSVSGLQVLAVPNSSTAVVHFLDLYDPSKATPFQDVRVRQALVYALDRAGIAKALYGQYATVPRNITFDFTLGNDASLPPYPYDPNKAKQLLKDAGATNLSITLHTYSATTAITDVQKLAQAVVGYWQQAGVNAKLDVVDPATYLPKYRAHGYDGAGILGYPAFGYFEPNALNTFYSSTGFYSSLNSPEIDTLFGKIATTISDTDRAALGKQLSDYLYNQVPAIPVISGSTLYGVGPKIASYKTIAGNPYAGPFWYLRAK